MRSFTAPAISLCLLAFNACGEETSSGRDQGHGDRRAGGDLVEVGPPAAPDFRHRFTRDTAYAMVESVGSGIAVLDADGDGRLDVLAVDGAGFPPRLYLQSGGAFEETRFTTGANAPDYGAGAAAADFDNDGRTDVYVAAAGPGRLYRNRGGTFEDVTDEAGIANAAWGTSAAWFDYDRDGWLDLVVVNYVDVDEGVTCSDRAGAREYCGPTAFRGAADRLYRNLGGGRFEDVSIESGIGGPAGRGLGVGILDYDRDGWPDIYVANDGEPNFLWRNRGDGTFEERAVAAGAAVNAAGQPEAGMGVAIADADGDGREDVFVTHLGGESNTLYAGGDDGFADETRSSGLHAPSLPFTGFGTGFADLDNDGDPDLIVANGRINRGPPVPDAPDGVLRPYAEPNAVYLNEGGRFVDVSDRFPEFTGRPGMSRALALADLDDDGGIDIIVGETGRELRLFRNELDRGRWIGFRVVDDSLGGRDVHGAVLEAYVGDRTRRARVNPNIGYLSTSDPRVHLGLGDASAVDSVVVTWPDGATDRWGQLALDRYHRLARGEGRASVGAGTQP